MKRKLTSAEIEALASRENVRRIAVENFLGTLPLHTTAYQDNMNLMMDANMYKWNKPTIYVIQEGITLSGAK